MDEKGAPYSDGGRIDRGLSRAQRLGKSYFFREAFAQDKSWRGRCMVMWVRSGADAGMRLGVVAGKKTFAKACWRSRAKRLLREAFRLNRYRLGGAYDVVLLARRPIMDASRQDVEKDFLILCERAGLLAGKQ
jgi:ribonuclease P protein component